MNPERKKKFLIWSHCPDGMNAAEAAWRLGFEPDHIPGILVSAVARASSRWAIRRQESVKFFLTVEIEQKRVTPDGWNKATEDSSE